MPCLPFLIRLTWGRRKAMSGSMAHTFFSGTLDAARVQGSLVKRTPSFLRKPARAPSERRCTRGTGRMCSLSLLHPGPGGVSG